MNALNIYNISKFSVLKLRHFFALSFNVDNLFGKLLERGGEIENTHFKDLTPFEKAYGVNPPTYTYKEDPVTKELTLHKTPSSVHVEIDKERVAKALGLRIQFTVPTMSMERQALNRKKFVLVDLSGTLHVEDVVTRDAILALVILRSNDFKVLFVTNTTKESKARLYNRLRNLGFDINIEELFTSMDATRIYVLENNLRPMLLVAEEAKEDFAGVETTDPNCVVVGLSSLDFNRNKLSEAFRLIMDKNAPIVAIHKGRNYRSATGMNMGPGCFVVALEKASQKTAVVLGKPEENFYNSALQYIGCNDPFEAVMIGDDIRDDVFGAMRAGITGILVKTGKWSPDDVKKISPHVPDYTFDDFAAAVKVLVKARDKRVD